MKFTPAGGNVDIKISRVSDCSEESSKHKVLYCSIILFRIVFLSEFLNLNGLKLTYLQHQVVGMVTAGSLRVEVTDSGAGIDSKDQNAIFGEFIQFNRNEQQQGGDY